MEMCAFYVLSSFLIYQNSALTCGLLILIFWQIYILHLGGREKSGLVQLAIQKSYIEDTWMLI